MHFPIRFPGLPFLLFTVLLSTGVSGQWTPMPLGTQQDLKGLDYRNGSGLWVGGVFQLHHSMDDGATFEAIAPPHVLVQGTEVSFLCYFTLIRAFDPQDLVVGGIINGGARSVMYRSTDGGHVFDQVYDAETGLVDEMLGITFGNGPVGLAVGSNAQLLRSTDFGQTWNAVDPGTTGTFSGVAWAGGTTWIAGGFTDLRRSVDNGLTWAAVPGVAQLDLVTGANGTYYGREGNTNALMKSIDAGATWVRTGYFSGIRAMAMVDANTLVAATDQGLFRSQSSGQYWEQFVLPDYKPVQSIAFKDAQNGVAVGEDGYAIRTNNAGGPAMPVIGMNVSSYYPCLGVPVHLTTTSDPAYDYTWIIDGVTVAQGPVHDAALAQPGPHVVSLIGSNGYGADTATATLTVAPPVQAAPFIAYASNDTICPGSYLNAIRVTDVASYTSYRLFRNGIQLGATQYGGGADLEFFVGTVQAGTTFMVRALRSNDCGADSLDVPVNLFMPSGTPETTGTLEHDSLCVPGSVRYLVHGSRIGYQYNYSAASGLSQPGIPGNGGTLVFDVPQITYPVPEQYIFKLYSRLPQLTSCAQLENGTDTLHVFSGQFSSTLADTTLVTGHSLFPDCIPGDHDQVHWDFGAGAEPSTFDGPHPPPVTYTAPGIYQPNVIALVGDSVCVQERTSTITVLPAAPIVQLPECGAAVASGSLRIIDMYVDAYNTTYLTGDQRIAGIKSFFALAVDSTGHVLWRNMHPTVQPNGSTGLGITADQEGNAYVVGAVDNFTATVQGQVVSYGSFLLKFNRHGVLQWDLSSPDMLLRSVTCTADNTIYAAGTGSGGYMELPAGDGMQWPSIGAQASTGGAFLLGLHTDGSVVEAKTFGRASDPVIGTSQPIAMNGTAPWGPFVESTSTGGLLISGLMAARHGAQAYDLDGTMLVDHAASDTAWNEQGIYVAHYTPQQGFTDAACIAGGRFTALQRVEEDADGSYRSCGRFRKALVLDGATVGHEIPGDTTAAGVEQSFLLRTDAAGHADWHTTGAGSTLLDVHGAPDGTTQVLAAFTGTGTFPSSTGNLLAAPSGGSVDMALLDYDAAGILTSLHQVANATGDIGYRMAADACDVLHIPVVSGLTGTFTVQAPMPCTTCTDNVNVRTFGAGACDAACTANIPVGGLDVALDVLGLANVDPDVTGPNGIRVELTGKGLTTASSVELGWRLNGGPAEVHTWTGQLPYAAASGTVEIGAPELDSRNHWTIEAWVQRVNGTIDDDQWNDTLRIEQIRCTRPIEGIYSLGPVGSDFPSFAAASNCLMTCGIEGPTTIEIADGDYYDQLEWGTVHGINWEDSIVFRSASHDSSKVRLHLHRRLPNNWDTWRFGPSSGYMTLQDLSLYNTMPSPLFTSVLHFVSLNSFINVLGCRLEGLPKAFGSVVWDGDDDFNTRIRLVGNTLRYMEYGMHDINSDQSQYSGVYTYKGNVFDRQERGGILQAWRLRNVVIDGNTFHTDQVNAAADYQALYLSGITDSPLGPFSLTVTRNTILREADNGQSDGSLVVVQPAADATSRTLFANNMVMDPMTISPSALLLNIQYTNAAIDVVNNTLGGPVRAGTEQAGDLVFRNNIVSSPGKVLIARGGMDQIHSDGNLFWSTAADLDGEWFSHDDLPYTLSGWTDTFGDDGLSSTIPPLFTAANDMHLVPGQPFFQCAVFPGITDDIDGDPRGSAFTRQGADADDLLLGLTDRTPADNGTWMAPSPNDGRFRLYGHGDAIRSYTVQDATGRKAVPITRCRATDDYILPSGLAAGAYRFIGYDATGHIVMHIPFMLMRR